MVRLLLSILLVVGFSACLDDSAKESSKTPSKVSVEQAENNQSQTQSVEGENNQSQAQRVEDKNRFSILSAKLSNENNVVIKFSQELSKDNEYKSLITLQGSGISSFKADKDTLTIIPQDAAYETHTLIVYKEIKNIDGSFLDSDFEKDIIFQKRKPSVKFVGKGVILPNSKFLEVPIEATNVKSVKLVAFKIFKNNIAQFLQENKFDGSIDLKKTGRYLWEKKIDLKDAVQNARGRYSLDVTKLLENENGSLIRLNLYIDRSDSMYECSDAENAVEVAKINKIKNLDSPDYTQSSSWDNYQNSYRYSDRKNPCKDSYYIYNNNQTNDFKNFLKSNIGIVAKMDADSENVYVATTAIETAKPLADVSVEVFNFQNQKIGLGKTKKDGLVKIKVSGIPFYVKVKKAKDIGYLKMTSGLSIPTNQFDVSGTHIKQNINGFIYGERDVWRPGDDIFLTFVLNDEKKKLPKNYPIRMELFDPFGQMIQSKVNSKPSGAMYAFKMNTLEEAKTGRYKVIAYVGNQKFTKNIPVETVVPNRLKVEFNINKEILNKDDKDLKGEIFSQWLHGASAKGLKASLSVNTFAVKTSFGSFSDYVFDDITREFRWNRQEIFNGKLDKDAKAEFPINIDINGNPAGMLKAMFTTKVFEEGGNFSSGTQGFIYHPYNQYVGLKLPKGDATRGMLLTDEDHTVDLVVLDSAGKPLANKDVTVSLHKISWRWWWDKGKESLAKYAQSTSYDAISSGDVKTDKNGRADWKLRVNYPSWGRYLVKACSKQSNHCSSKIVYIDWPGWAGRAVEQNNNSVSTLTISSDKTKYKVGETATISLPKSEKSRLLVSLENGTDVIDQFWVDSSKSNIKIPITKEMAPNFYVSVSLIQPHSLRENDRPIRLMGVLNIMVDNPNTHLDPVLKMPDEVAPEKEFEIKVQEKNGKAMDYSLAIVDEGLLGLTNYKTPSLHKHFYKRKGLQVKTWDIYDDVVGAYSGDLERMLAIGGGAEAQRDELKDKKRRRFEPVVQYLGTFSLEKGKTKIHKVTIPKYMGAVRVMLVASKNSKYGKSDKSVVVRSPISMIVTMPRALHVDEEISLPIEIFVQKDGIKSVNVSVEAESEYFDVIEGVKRLTFNKQGEQITQLKLKTKNKLGKAKVTIFAKSGKEVTSKTIYIDISSINPKTFESTSKRLKMGEEWSVLYKPHGIAGTNDTSLELSTVPALDLGNRIDYLIRYPHGCIEQTTSSVFPQLYLSDITELSKEKKDEVEHNVNAAIERLQSFQVNGGGLSYWPGMNKASPWGTNYAMHFLLEAKKKGFNVPKAMLDKLISYQIRESKKTISSSQSDTKIQAYRLFVLAKASKANLSAMYRLKENKNLSNVSKWLLSATYASIGQTDISKEIAVSDEIPSDIDVASDVTFASSLREKAIMLLGATLVKDFNIADTLATEISNELASDKWFNTQAVAYSLLAMSNYAVHSSPGFVDYKIENSDVKHVTLKKSIKVVNIKEPSQKGVQLYFKNMGEKPVTVLIANKGVSPKGEEKNKSNGLELSIQYLDKDGKEIDASKLKQGTSFSAKMVVKNLLNRDLKNLVLSYKLPSGWQILNTRYADGSNSSNVDYQDIRDDKVYTYFSMTKNETKEVSINLNASYKGEFYLPATVVESMYDNKISALNKGMNIEISK